MTRPLELYHCIAPLIYQETEEMFAGLLSKVFNAVFRKKNTNELSYHSMRMCQLHLTFQNKSRMKHVFFLINGKLTLVMLKCDITKIYKKITMALNFFYLTITIVYYSSYNTINTRP